MNTIKNFEALFLVAAATAAFATYATAAMPLHAAAPALVRTASAPAVATPQMQVVVIKGRRLSAAEKAAL